MTPEDALRAVEEATSPAALFPDLEAAKNRYRRLARSVHPDRNGGSDRARQAFAKLSEFYAARTGNAGRRTARIGPWVATGGLARGALCDLFTAVEASGGGGDSAILKLVRAPRDNALVSQEAAVLSRLRREDGLEENFYRYLPRLLDTFLAGGRRANVFSRAEDYYSMEYIRNHARPAPLDFRHIVWMGNRLWEILGAVHAFGVAHDAVLPHHCLYRPSDHGLVLVDWTNSFQVDGSAEGGRLAFLHKRWSSLYPPEVRRARAGPWTDIYMAAASLRWAAGRRIPRRFRVVFDWLLAESPNARPSDAWKVQDRWRDAARDEYGPPRFVELQLNVH